MRKRRKGGGNLPPGSHRNWWENGPGRKAHQAMARHGAGRWRTLGGLAGMTWMKDSWASVSSQIHSLIPLLQAALPGGPPSIFHPPTHRSWVISPPSQASGCEAPPGAAFPPLPMTAKSFPGSHSCFSSCRSASPTLGGRGLGSQIQPCCWSSSLEAADLSLALRLVGPSLWSYPRVFHPLGSSPPVKLALLIQIKCAASLASLGSYSSSEHSTERSPGCFEHGLGWGPLNHLRAMMVNSISLTEARGP